MAASVVGVPNIALANKYGELHITANTTLTDHQYGAVIFDASNITLDCNWHTVHISSFTTGNCAGRKCAISAVSKSNIVVKNCDIVGNFDYGVWLDNTEGAWVDHIESNAINGFQFTDNSSLTATNLIANSNRIGVFVQWDIGGWYENVAVASSLEYGIIARDSIGTTFSSAYSAYAGRDGMTINGGSDIWLQNSTFLSSEYQGLVVYNHPGLVLLSNVVRWNGAGIWMRAVDNGYFQENTSDDNAGCDAFEDWSTGTVWVGNSLEDICGNVPAVH